MISATPHAYSLHLLMCFFVALCPINFKSFLQNKLQLTVLAFIEERLQGDTATWADCTMRGCF